MTYLPLLLKETKIQEINIEFLYFFAKGDIGKHSDLSPLVPYRKTKKLIFDRIIYFVKGDYRKY